MREDKTAAIWQTKRIVGGRRSWFAFGKGSPQKEVKLDTAWVDEASQTKDTKPVLVFSHPRVERRWWWYKGRFYVDEENLDEETVHALLHKRETRKQASIDKAKAELRGEQQRAFKREPIPEAVRHEVWRRDGGRCVDCGSRENLEFDHIVPVSKGGANTARNIELRCASCNRSKSADI